MLYDLHLIADAFLAEEELGRQRGSEESETEGISPSDDLPLSLLPPASEGEGSFGGTI